ncbi:HDIG domain-containing metalloprotein [Actinoplanes sp. NPDC049548]|uniref:HDIG domain-containing metalloprotein n=1 Tax=Actinoplanes sp. NPDC049548 TaxID=3155152 RepID=UPI0034215F45
MTVVKRQAERLARQLLRRDQDRLRHTAGVAERAAALAGPLGADAELLTAAAWLHDIGYAPSVAVTGFHPLDGARHLYGLRWPAEIVGLVAQHSGAAIVAAAEGHAAALAAFPVTDIGLYDALTYADQTVGPTGERVTWHQRYDEMMGRHRPDSANVRVDALRRPHLAAVAARVERRLAEAGGVPDGRISEAV